MAVEDTMNEARTLVLQCFEEDQIIREDTVQKLSHVVACLMVTAATFVNNETYYRNLLDKCAENLGPLRPKVFVQDDGGIVDHPLRAKLPELVAELATHARKWMLVEQAVNESTTVAVSSSQYSDLPVT